MQYDKDSIVQLPGGLAFSGRFMQQLWDRADYLYMQGKTEEAKALESEFFFGSDHLG